MFGFVSKAKYEAALEAVKLADVKYEKALDIAVGYKSDYEVALDDHVETLRDARAANRRHNSKVTVLEHEVADLTARLEIASINGTSTQFTQPELRSLISLCHPDKHQQKTSAVTITQKLLSLRKKEK